MAAASLPTRERGLKSVLVLHLDGCIRSLPTRERGLKSLQPVKFRFIIASLPTRERGLKSQAPLLSAQFQPGRSLHGSVD